MKKIILALAASIALVASAAAQVLPSAGIKNTTWTGLGLPLDGDFCYHGILDTFQARYDVGNFTIEGMITGGFLCNYKDSGSVDNFTFGISDKNPLQFLYGSSHDTNNASLPVGFAPATPNNAFNYTNVKMDPYYVNFFWSFGKYFQVGVGTKLNWQVGPAPTYGGWLWEDTSHVRQGGFSTWYDDRSGAANVNGVTGNRGQFVFRPDAPGSSDVVGFIHYANKYAKTALGARFRNKDILQGLEIGLAIPDQMNTDNFLMNAGFHLGITKWLQIAAALEGIFNKNMNFYTGATIGFNRFVLNAYFAWDAMFAGSENHAYGTGADLTFRLGSKNQFMLKPEVGFNFFGNSNYTLAWYTGITFDWSITDIFGFGAFSSIAFGSSDKRWEDYSVSKDWHGGVIFDIRPDVYFNFTKNLKLTIYMDYQHRNAFDKTVRNCWSTGVYLTYKLNK